jgi:hypothetical protein
MPHQLQRFQSSIPSSSFHPNLAGSSLMQSLMLPQQSFGTQRLALQQMVAQAWSAAATTAPHLFPGYQPSSFPSPPVVAIPAAAATLSQGPPVKAALDASAVQPNPEPSLQSTANSCHAQNVTSNAASSPSLHSASAAPPSSSPPSPIDSIASSITIPFAPSQIPMTPLDYIPAASRAGCLSSMPPPSNRRASCDAQQYADSQRVPSQVFVLLARDPCDGVLRV